MLILCHQKCSTIKRTIWAQVNDDTSILLPFYLDFNLCTITCMQNLLQTIKIISEPKYSTQTSLVAIKLFWDAYGMGGIRIWVGLTHAYLTSVPFWRLDPSIMLRRHFNMLILSLDKSVLSFVLQVPIGLLGVVFNSDSVNSEHRTFITFGILL